MKHDRGHCRDKVKDHLSHSANPNPLLVGEEIKKAAKLPNLVDSMSAETAPCLNPETFSTARLITKPTMPVRTPMTKQKVHLSTTYRT